MNPAALLPVLALIAGIGAVSAMAGRIKVRGAPVGAVGVLLTASVLSAAAAIIGLPTESTRDAAVVGMAWTLAASLLALGLGCAGALLRWSSAPVVGLALLLVLVESGVPILAGHLLGWSRVETAAMASNAAAAVSALAATPDLAADPAWWGAFGLRYLVQMLLPLGLLAWYLRNDEAIGHHTRASRAYARAVAIADAGNKREHELDATKTCLLSDVLAVAEIRRIDRGGVSLAPADVAGGVIPGDAIVIHAGRQARARVAALVGHHDRRWAWPVAAVLVIAGTYLLHWQARISLPVAALLAAVATGAATGALLPAPVMRWLRRWGLVGFLATTGIALGGQCVHLSPGPLLQYLLVAIAPSCACWWGAIWLGRLILPGSPKMRALGTLAGSTTSSGLSESIAAKTGSDVAVIAFAAAYPLSSVAKVIVVQAILAHGG